VNIIRALNDPAVFGRYFREESWNVWRVFLATLFGLPLTYDQQLLFKQFTGRTVAPTKPLQEAWLVVGRRGGKSFILAVIAVFLACFKDWRPYLGPGEVGTIMIIAKDRDQARNIKRFISGMLREVPMLSRVFEDETAEAIRLKNRVVIEVHTASYRSTRGYTIIAALLDEVAVWESDETAAEPDVEIVNAIKPGMATIPGAMLLCASSPHARKGVLWDAYRKHFGKDGDPILVWQAATRAMNPSVPQSFIDGHVAEDPAAAMAEYGAQFRDNVAAFISQEIINAAVVPGRYELPPVDGVHYTGAVDVSGGSSDSMTLGITHVESDKIGTLRAVDDLIREVKPPFSPDDVVAEFAEILKSYGITEVWSDNYAAVWPRERFAKHGIHVHYPHDRIPRIKSTSDIYREWLPILNSRRHEALDHTVFVTQLQQLQRHVAPGGKDTIRHPNGGRDDVVNAIACAVVMALNTATQVRTSFPMPFVAGTPRYVPGGSALGVPVVGGPHGGGGFTGNYPAEPWRAWINSDGSIRSTPRSPWDT
jgi:hypothetical protein